MAIFEIVEGPPGQGKSIYTASLTLRLLSRNLKWFQKTGIRRRIATNQKLSPALEKEWGLYPENPLGFIEYWTDTYEVVNFRDVDLIWDEIATELDSRNFANLSVEMKRFLSQYRKRGVDIYANTQDFSMIDARARLMITRVRTMRKVMGSRDISTTKPPVKHVWGVILIRDVDNFRETEPEKKKYSWFSWGFLFITKRLIAIYDTTQDIPLGKPAPLKHTVLYCEHYGKPGHENCSHKKIVHS